MNLLHCLLPLMAQVVAEPPPVIDVEGFPSSDTEVIDTSIDRALRMTLPVMIGAEGPFDFFVDTGSQSTVLSRDVGKKLDLPSDGTATLVSVAKRTQVDLVQLDGLMLGNRVINGLSAPLLERRNLGADGIIGIDSLQDFRVLLDFRDNTLAVVESEQVRRNSGYEIVVRAQTKLGRMLVTNARLDGIETVVIIDTGSQASIGNFALKNRLRRKNGEQVEGIDVVGAAIDARFQFARELRIGNVMLPRLPIAFSDALIFKELGLKNRPAILLGMQDLRGFDRVAIDFAERKVLFDLPSRFRAGSGTTLLASRAKI